MSNETNFEVLAATALVGLIFQSITAYRDACPSLQELRDADSNDPKVLQALIDADITIGIPVLIAGAVAAWVMKSFMPLAVILVAFAATAGYHHSILSDHTEKRNA